MPQSAQPPLEFIAPDLNPLLLRVGQTLLPLWLRWKTNITSIEVDNLDTLLHLYEDFQLGKNRFLIAFRHPSVNDPYCLAYLWWKLLPRGAKEAGIPLKKPIHGHFMYDRGIPLWAGERMGWVYSRLGGTSIQRGKTDLMGLKSARKILLDGQFPLAAAPEGATNGHNEIISPLEPGLSQLAFWCAEDIRKAGRTQEVFILPIGIQYFYVTPPWEEVSQLLTGIESDCGLTSLPNQPANASTLYERLFRLGEHFLSIMENFYREFYHRSLPTIVTGEDDPNKTLSIRLSHLMEAALGVAEQYFNLSGTGTVIDRCRRLEQASWDYIYREALKPSNSISPVERGLADQIAREADLKVWHMRIAETFVAVTGHYVKEKPSVERFTETILLLWDLVARIKGDNSFFRPLIGKQRVKMTIGTPISVTARQPAYKNDRRAAVASLTQDLQASLQNLIIPN
ncbi:MAG: hypothetical protein N5P05_000110 [Chroococcopsis gigantea SAG 12.99]|jgi:1-acyl-sn-glycerol-3-phosphate acyltransferase|nr:1-acyl-sn-glycerol-3-phosphate acyltransferase [Chlorogloea purpurea SAG 13.99]MDV2998504.1 hypothetical protein [Chroococcopsis gigantea SAG 12.99]